MDRKFNPKEVDKLRKPERLQRENPQTVWENIGLSNPSCLVDVGCGIGFASIPFARHIPAGTVYACDISQEMLDILKEEIGKAGVKNIKPVLVEEAKIPLADGIADAVLMQNIHHELHAEVEILKECRRLLKPGGKIAIVDWKKEPMDIGPPQEIRVSVKKIGSDLREAGFTQIQSLDLLAYHSFVLAQKP